MNKILTIPEDDTFLRQKSNPVAEITLTQGIRTKMLTELKKHKQGAGIAAVQLGILLQIMAVNLTRRPGFRAKTVILINPKIELLGKEIISREGCLSIPGFIGEIKRNDMVRVEYLDETGKKLDGFFTNGNAIVIQHEVDHFDGVLFIDKAEKAWEV